VLESVAGCTTMSGYSISPVVSQHHSHLQHRSLVYVASPCRTRPDPDPTARFGATRHLAGNPRRAFSPARSGKGAGDGVASNAIKILMNSFYGVLGTPACRFYNPALANSITASDANLLWSKQWFEARAMRCCTAIPTVSSSAPATPRLPIG